MGLDKRLDERLDRKLDETLKQGFYRRFHYYHQLICSISQSANQLSIKD